MHAFEAAATPPRSGAPYQFDRHEMELAGRRRSLWRTAALAAGIFVLQQPLRWVATGHWESVEPIPAEVPVRLSLLLDLAMVVVYVVLAIRLFEVARSRPGSSSHRADGKLALGLVALGAALDVVEDVVLWRRGGGAELGDRVDLTVGWLTFVMWTLVVLGLVLGLLAATWIGKGSPAPAPPPPPFTSEPPAEPRRPGLIICCSGGGIRAAAFSLGGLQALKRHYGRADAVVGVSGGGYMAASHHVLRWCSSDATHDEWADLDPPAYAPDSPEEKWLRRHSRYLLDSTRAGVIAVLSLLYGIAVNLLFVAVGLGAAAWVTSWFLLASGGITDWGGDAAALGYTGDWAWAGASWAVLALGVGLFVVAKVVDRLTPAFDVVGRERVRAILARTVVTGLILVVALLVLPVVLVTLYGFATADHDEGSVAAALAALLGVVGFSEALPGLPVSAASLGAVALAVLTTVRAVGSVVPGAEQASGSAVRTVLSKLWKVVKAVVLPWVATVVVMLLLLAVFLTWTVALLSNPVDLANWRLAGFFGGLLVGVLLLSDVNRTSLHHFYRERLSSAYLVRRGPRGRPEQIDYTRALRFSASAPYRQEGTEQVQVGPELVSCAVANVNDSDVVPTDRGCTPFVFSHRHMGLSEEILPDEAMVPSEVYEFAADSRGRDATIPAAMAISGAAFSPLAGRENALLAPYRLVLALANARLGVWLPNPLWIDAAALQERRERARSSRLRWWGETLRSLATKPTPLLVAREAFGRTSVLDRFLYVTDGGHYDNLGLVEALRRRPRQVVVLDASNDVEDTFETLGRAIATARMDLGAEVEIDPRSMRRLSEQRAGAAWVRGTVLYREDEHGARATGEVWIAKAILLDDHPWDVETYSARHPEFPRSSTGDQFYGEFDLEAYRALGHDVARRLVPELDRPGTPSVATCPPVSPRRP